MSLEWARTTAGAMFAIRDVLRDNLGTELTTRAALIAAGSKSYTIPSTITSTDIYLARLLKRPMGRACPQVQIRWAGRRLIDKADGLGQGHALHLVEIFWWLSNLSASADDGLISEEVLELACLDWGEAIVATLKRYTTGVYSAASGLTTVEEQSFGLAESYQDVSDNRVITTRGKLVLTVHQETEYL